MSARSKLVLLAAIFFVPPMIAYYLFWFSPPTRYSNYGTLLPPTLVSQAPLMARNGGWVTREHWARKWVLLVVGDATCDATCQEQLVIVRQLRLTQGREMDRVARMWLVRGDVAKIDQHLLGQHPGLLVASMSTEWARALESDRAHERRIFLIDPAGNLMMRFPEHPEPKRMMKDLQRLLYANKSS